jgi:hypothetical protein
VWFVFALEHTDEVIVRMKYFIKLADKITCVTGADRDLRAANLSIPLPFV